MWRLLGLGFTDKGFDGLETHSRITTSGPYKVLGGLEIGLGTHPKGPGQRLT